MRHLQISKAESTGKYLIVVLKRQYPSLDIVEVSDDSITNQSETQVANSANPLYIAIASDTEPQST